MSIRPFRLPARVFCIASLLACFACDAEGVSDLTDGSSLQLSDEVPIEGTLGAQIATYPDGTTETTYYVESDGEYVDLDLDTPPDADIGSFVQVYGDDLDDVVAVDELVVVSPPPQPLIDAEPRAPRRVAFVMVHWGSPDSLTPAEAKQLVYTNATSTNMYYGEVSYGIETISGDVFGWYEISPPSGCGERTIAEQARQAMSSDGVNVDDYEQIMYYFPRSSGCGWSGLASVGSPTRPARDSWYNGSAGCVVLAQELGHNYGMLHSHTYSCTEGGQEVAYSSSCSSSEYGHPFDPMGSGCGHMNVYQKSFMGWLQECNIVTATSNGQYNLVPTEVPCDGTQALRVPTGDGQYYYIEYRQPEGEFDSPSRQWSEGLSGVLVHVAGEYEGTRNPESWLLDMTPGTISGGGWGRGDHNDGFLGLNETFTDPTGSVSITVTTAADSHAVLDVEFADGGSGSPTCADGSQPTMAQGAHGSLECSGIVQDMEPPTVEITYPADGEVFEEGSSFDLTAEATDDRGVVETELLLDGMPQQKRSSPPYSWSISDIPTGSYTFSVLARDSLNETESESVTIEVIDEGAEPPGTDTDTGDTGTDGPTGDDPDTGDDGGSSTDTGTQGPDTGTTTDTDGWLPPGPGASGTDPRGCGCRAERGATGAPLALLGFVVLGAARLRWPRRRA